jgi:hypothetical protein
MDIEKYVQRIKTENPNEEQLKLILTQFEHTCHDYYFEKGCESIRESYHNRKEKLREIRTKSISNWDAKLSDMNITKVSQLLKRMSIARPLVIEFFDLFNITDLLDADEVYRIND